MILTVIFSYLYFPFPWWNALSHPLFGVDVFVANQTLFTQAAMVTCDGCSKTFLPPRLEAHQRVCPNNNPFKKAAPSIPKQVSVTKDYQLYLSREGRVSLKFTRDLQGGP